MAHRYLIALGSNIRHHRYGAPERVLRVALAELEAYGVEVEGASPVFRTAPLGPSRRDYANAAAVVRAPLEPPAMLALLKRIEAGFGRRRGGARWRARVLDLDIVLWSGGQWTSPGLQIPHREFRARAFVLRPACTIAPGWRDPVTGRTLAQLLARLTRNSPATPLRRS